MKILALDLGKFNSVSCFYDTLGQAAVFFTATRLHPSAQGWP